MTISDNITKEYFSTLSSRNNALFYKVLFTGTSFLSNDEKDELAICARIARMKVESK